MTGRIRPKESLHKSTTRAVIEWTVSMRRKARFQPTLASQVSFEKHGRKSKRELFLDQMEQVVPWSELSALVAPHYPKAGTGRQPVGLSIMLRTYFLQQWFNLSDPGMEEAFYESLALRRFAGVDLGRAFTV